MVKVETKQSGTDSAHGLNVETINERANRYERWLLCAILLQPEMIHRVKCKAQEFLTTAHGDIFEAMCQLSKSEQKMDLIAVVDEAERISKDSSLFIYVSTLYDEHGVVPENIERYDREVIAASRRRSFQKFREELGTAETRTEQLRILDSMWELLVASPGASGR